MMLTENLKNDDGESSLESTDEHGGESLPGVLSISAVFVLESQHAHVSPLSHICTSFSNGMPSESSLSYSLQYGRIVLCRCSRISQISFHV